jgi:hypothetical protein
MSTQKPKYEAYVLAEPGRALYANLIEASKPKTAESAKTRYSVTLGLGERDATARAALADRVRAIERDIGRVGISKPGIAQPGKDQIGVHVIPPGDLAHRHTGHTRLPADHPLLFIRPNPTLPTLRHKQPR